MRRDLASGSRALPQQNSYLCLALDQAQGVALEVLDEDVRTQLIEVFMEGVPGEHGPVMPKAGIEFLEAVIAMCSTSSYWSAVPDQASGPEMTAPAPASGLHDHFIIAAQLADNARQLYDEVIATDGSPKLAGRIDTHRKALENLRDQLHDLNLSAFDLANGAVPRWPRDKHTATSS